MRPSYQATPLRFTHVQPHSTAFNRGRGFAETLVGIPRHEMSTETIESDPRPEPQPRNLPTA